MALPRARFDIDVGGVASLLGDFGDELDATMDAAMGVAVDMVATDAKFRAPDKTGELRNSIGGVVTGSFRADNLVGIVSAGAPHALPVEDGSVAHDIVPKHRKALRWPLSGFIGPRLPAGSNIKSGSGFGFAKRVHIPAQAARPFLEPALEANADDILAEFEAARDLAARKAKR